MMLSIGLILVAIGFFVLFRKIHSLNLEIAVLNHYAMYIKKEMEKEISTLDKKILYSKNELKSAIIKIDGSDRFLSK